jgi:hypothetical protein
MRRETLDRERACDPDAGIVGVGLVVQVFELGLGSDRGVDLLLTIYPRFPPLGVQLGCLCGPCRAGLTWDFPFLTLL